MSPRRTTTPGTGKPGQRYRVDRGPWRPMPANHVFYTGKLAVGPHQVSVRTANRAGSTQIRFGWRVVPLPAPLACQPRAGQPCWYPPHLAANHRPMRWDWQIGLTTPLKRTGKHAVDIYDIDGFLTTRAEVHAIQARWQASTLAAPEDHLLPGPGLGGLPPGRQLTGAGRPLPGRHARERVLRLPRGAVG